MTFARSRIFAGIDGGGENAQGVVPKDCREIRMVNDFRVCAAQSKYLVVAWGSPRNSMRPAHPEIVVRMRSGGMIPLSEIFVQTLWGISTIVSPGSAQPRTWE